MQLFQNAKYDIVSNNSKFATLSLALVVISVLLVGTLGINFGIDFAGGYEIQVALPDGVGETQIRSALTGLDLGDVRVQRFGDESSREFLIMVREHGTLTDEMKITLKEAVFALVAGGVDGKEGVSDWNIAESGETFRVAFTQPVDEEQLRDAVTGMGLLVKNIERGERVDEPEYRVTLIGLSDQITKALLSSIVLPEGTDPVRRVEFVGPQVGAQLRNQGIMAVLWSLVFILLYIGVRFDLFFAPGAIIALIHDVTITMGVFAALQLEFNLPVIAAILTIVGYSLNDTIVVYDRIRENVLRLRGSSLHNLVNTSINQTLSRTVLTSVTTMVVVLALLVFGGGIIRDFAIALAVGVLVGTYSSIAIAAPTYIAMRERYGVDNSKKSASGRPAVNAA